MPTKDTKKSPKKDDRPGGGTNDGPKTGYTASVAGTGKKKAPKPKKTKKK